MDSDLQPTLHQRCEWIHTFPFRVFLFNKYKIKPAPRWLGLDSSWIWQKEHLRVFMRTQFYASGLGWSLTESQFHSHLSQRNAAHPVCDSTKYQSDQQGHLPRIFSSSCRLDSRIWSMSEWIRTSCCRTDIRQSSFSAESPSSRCSWTRM